MKKFLLTSTLVILFLAPFMFNPVNKTVSAKPLSCVGILMQANGYGINESAAQDDACFQNLEACAAMNGAPENCEVISCGIKGGIWRCTARMCCGYN